MNRNTHHPLTLFILKRFQDYGGGSLQTSNGLNVSACFIVEMLSREGYRAKLVEAIDANCIDRIVTEHQPATVIIEALWVTPAKMAELKALHPSIRWNVRIHSELPFLANEGVAVEWIAAYLAMRVGVSFNSVQTARDFEIMGDVDYLPNFYPLRRPRSSKPASEGLDIGCFGAVRPLKNQLIQAFGAIRFAGECGMPMTFHMNSSRIEQAGESNLKNIEALFAANHNCNLVLHPWMDHEDFLELIACMDMCLQVSLSESFNITSADAVSMGVPLVGSDAITWLPKRSLAEVDNVESICSALHRADRTMVDMNHEALDNYLMASLEAWKRWLHFRNPETA